MSGGRPSDAAAPAATPAPAAAPAATPATAAPGAVDVGALRAALAARPRRAGAPAGHPARPSAVLALVVPAAAGPRLVYTLRPAALAAHAGQISFPGGKLLPGEDPVAGALREAREEIGVDPAAVTVAGLLDDEVTPTGYLMTPVVGVLAASAAAFAPDPREVAELFALPLAELADPARCRDLGPLTHAGVPYHRYELHVAGRVIWGATARITRRLLERWPR